MASVSISDGRGDENALGGILLTPFPSQRESRMEGNSSFCFPHVDREFQGVRIKASGKRPGPSWGGI